MTKLIVATKNKGKLQEMRLALGNQIELIGIEEVSLKIKSPQETGETYLQNASLKASFYRKIIQQPVLADDGGLELEGFPHILGVKTHNFFKSTDPLQQNQEILQLLAEQPDKSRKFILRAVLVYQTSGREISVSKQLTGEIASPRGNLGYGFDPILYIPEIGKTLGELSLTQRNALSPRINALKEILPKIKASLH